MPEISTKKETPHRALLHFASFRSGPGSLPSIPLTPWACFLKLSWGRGDGHAHSPARAASPVPLPVFLLKDSEGTTWICKNYTTAMDPTLTYEVLPNLDKRLKHLPAGFKFYTRTLDRDLVIKAVGRKARIMWDELGGSWGALDPGVANYQP